MQGCELILASSMGRQGMTRCVATRAFFFASPSLMRLFSFLAAHAFRAAVSRSGPGWTSVNMAITRWSNGMAGHEMFKDACRNVATATSLAYKLRSTLSIVAHMVAGKNASMFGHRWVLRVETRSGSCAYCPNPVTNIPFCASVQPP